MPVFQYGEEEAAYLAARDPRMAEVIAAVGISSARFTRTCSPLL